MVFVLPSWVSASVVQELSVYLAAVSHFAHFLNCAHRPVVLEFTLLTLELSSSPMESQHVIACLSTIHDEGYCLCPGDLLAGSIRGHGLPLLAECTWWVFWSNRYCQLGTML